MDKTKPFGLTIPKRSQKSTPFKSASVFESDSDDDTSKKFSQTKIPQKKLPSKPISKDAAEDPSIYEYDEIYDDMKAEQVAKVAPKDKNKPSRYIDTLLKAADKRKKEYERRVEKKVQVERVKEGDKYKDKEEFVTSAYKKKMQEMEEEEERERRRNELDEMMDVTKQKDLSGFYRHFLNQTVGEEKIPDLKSVEIKQEPIEKEESERKQKPKVQESDDKIGDVDAEQSFIYEDRDSSIISSSSDEEMNEEKELQSTNVLKPKRQLRKQRSNSEDSETSGSETENKEENLIKAEIDCDSHSESESDESLSKEETSKLNGKRQNVSNDKKIVKKCKIDIFAKRTVGDVFAEAQARFFQRMALKNA